MSPKSCSLAYDDVEVMDQNGSLNRDFNFEPELTVHVKRKIDNSSASDEVTRISGRINVSF